MEERKENAYPELEYFFCHIEGVGFRTLKKLIDRVPNWEKAYELPQKQLEELLGSKMAELIVERKKQANPLQMWKQLQQQEILFASYWNSVYPETLRCIQEPPKALYALGQMPSPEEKRVAVIGARACSEYGRRMARQFGEDLAGQGIAVVSGMARGIDGISQRYALEAGGISYAVLGCGVDVCYPRENRALYDTLRVQGGILSEYVPGTEAKAQLFPPRNRIISGLSDVIVVVEARKKSGTIITVDMALEQGKEVMVVPGRVGDGLSEGCNDLLRQGAAPVLESADILKLLGMEEKGNRKGADGTSQEERAGLSGKERLLYALLDEYPRSIDELARDLIYRREEMDYSGLCRILHSLCRKGVARQEGNTHFVKVKA